MQKWIKNTSSRFPHISQAISHFMCSNRETISPILYRRLLHFQCSLYVLIGWSACRLLYCKYPGISFLCSKLHDFRLVLLSTWAIDFQIQKTYFLIRWIILNIAFYRSVCCRDKKESHKFHYPFDKFHCSNVHENLKIQNWKSIWNQKIPKFSWKQQEWKKKFNLNI